MVKLMGFILALSYFTNIVGQSSNNGMVTGSVFVENQQPADFATIALMRMSDTFLSKTTLPDKDGGFQLENIAPEKYFILISYIGYDTYRSGEINISPEMNQFKLGDIILNASTQTLSEVEVTAKVPLIERKLDRIIINVENSNVMEIATLKKMDDELNWVKFSGAAWKGDGFYYARYDAPAKGKELSSKNEYHKIYFHKLGTPQANDELVYENKKFPLRYYGAQTTEDESFLVIYVSEGTDGTELYSKNLAKGQKDFTMIFPGFNDNATVINNVGEKLIVQTDADAPNQKIVSIDPMNPAKDKWTTIVAEKEELLEGTGTAGGKLFASYLKDVTTRVYQHDMTGKVEREIQLPALGTAGGFGGNFDDQFSFYTFTSFTYPPTIYKYDIASGKSDVFRSSEVKFKPEDYETKQVFFTSKDGAKVPMFIVHKKGIKLDGTNPTMLYGYGGFNISLTPSFSTSRIVLLENGGIYAMVNLRGGGEYGEKWHEAGKLFKKQNVFDDCIGAAEYLIKEKYTSADRLALMGGSNGGLLVGAVVNQRPELFKVAFPAVGVMDMLRFHKFTVGWGWVVEYGSSDSLDHFNNLIKFSPVHNVNPDVEYPAVMVTTADHDDRVVPAHSFKYIATLQEKRGANKNPLLIRVDVKAGHGAGKPISKTIEEQADIWSFMMYNMNVQPIYK